MIIYCATANDVKDQEYIFVFKNRPTYNEVISEAKKDFDVDQQNIVRIEIVVCELIEN